MKKHLEILRLAHHGLREGERHEAVERVGRAIRALEVTLEGRRDREAEKIRERSPGHAELADCLLLAAELWHHFGQPDKGRPCAELGRHLQKTARERDRDRPREDADHRRDRPPAGGVPDRLERLENHVRKLTDLVDKLHAEIRRLRERER
jgi:hypothetical protein